jgi:hypothetical protein
LVNSYRRILNVQTKPIGYDSLKKTECYTVVFVPPFFLSPLNVFFVHLNKTKTQPDLDLMA